MFSTFQRVVEAAPRLHCASAPLRELPQSPRLSVIPSLCPSVFSVCSVLKSFVALLLAAAGAWSADGPLPPGLEDVPQIVAEVKGKPVTREELLREVVGSGGSQALDRLVRRKLIEQAARKLGVSVSAEEIEQQLVIDKRDLNNELIRDFTDVNREFPMADLIYARYRMTLEEYKDLVVRQRLLVRRCVAKDLAPTDAVLKQFLQDNIDNFQPPVQYHASHILITPFDPRDRHRGLRFQNPAGQMAKIKQDRTRNINLYRDHGIDLDGRLLMGDERDPAWQEFRRQNPNVQLGAPEFNENFPHRQQALRVLQEIRSGAIKWDDAVRKYTQDPLDTIRLWPDGRRQSERERLGRWNKTGEPVKPGDVGWFDKNGPLVPDFYAGAKDLRVGEIGGPVPTYYGYHLIKMLAIEAPPPVAFEQIRDKVKRAYEDNEVLGRSEMWLDELVRSADLQTRQPQLWLPTSGKAAPAADADPVVAEINGAPLKRSEVWRELLRSDGEDALNRLVNFEIIMTLLKNMGFERLEWEIQNPSLRNPAPPLSKPIIVKPEAIDRDPTLTDDRLRWDAINEYRRALKPPQPELSFGDYIYQKFGQSEEEYRRKVEAGIIVREAIRRRVPADEKTLLVEYALAREYFSEPLWYELSHILIKPTGGMDKAGKDARLQATLMIEQVHKLCEAKPEDFSRLVQEYSMDSADNKARGGSVGPCYPDRPSPEYPELPVLYAEVKRQKLERGQFSAPVPTVRGYHVVRVDAVHPAMPARFEQVKHRVERAYLQERAKMHTDMWLRSLTDQARVKKFLFAAKGAPNDALPPDNFEPPRDKKK